jgi:DHA3 family multidrug efflux protein-like MFS transporter
MKTFYQLLANALVVATKNNFVWFALTYWVYLETRSVVSTSIISGLYLVATAVSGFWFGSLVDRYKKKAVMLWSNIATLALFGIGFCIYLTTPSSAFTSVSSVMLWIFVCVLLAGTITGNIIGIAIPTLVTTLVPEKMRDRANGMFGTAMGISFSITSFASGIVLAYGGMFWVLLCAIVVSVIGLVHLISITISEKRVVHAGGQPQSQIDIKGTIRAITAVPGLFALIFFTTFNNFLGGVFMSLLDAYGLTLVSVQVWGAIWGFLSMGFIIGGLYISRYGLGVSPLNTLFRINIVTWTVCIFFTIQPSIVLLCIGMLIWMCLVPFVEAVEQTIIQKVVPPERQGRVFGFAHSVEQAASPITAFFIGPIAQYLFIPFMTTGRGVDLIGGWFGVGDGRGIALVFTIAGIIGLLVTLIAMHSRAYTLLSKRYAS